MTPNAKNFLKIQQAEREIPAIAETIPPGALTSTARELLDEALTRLGISLSSPRAHQVARDMEDTRDCQDVAALLTRAVELERAAREDWLARALRPWCERHGLTLRQGLSVLFDDGAFNPDSPSKDRVTAKDMFAWGGAQNDFASRLMNELANETAPPQGLALVVLSAGGVMEMTFHGKAPWAEVETIDCQNGEAGDVFSFEEMWAPILDKAFGVGDWPRYVRIEGPDEIDVAVRLEDELQRPLFMPGIWSEEKGELIITCLNRDHLYHESYNRLVHIRFTDERPPLVPEHDVRIEEPVDGISVVAISQLTHSDQPEEDLPAETTQQ